MAHCIQAIVTKSHVADRIRAVYPQLPSVGMRQGFIILPVDDLFVDSVTEPQASQSSETWMRLTDAFHDLLRELSRFGPLAYIETEYFGGVGGQGAAVYSDGMVVMKPEWSNSGTINRALKLIGVKSRLLGDRFSALGLDQYRSNDDLMDNDPPVVP